MALRRPIQSSPKFPARYDFTITCGTSVTLMLRIRQDDGTFMDFSDVTCAKLQVRQALGHPTALLTLSIANGKIAVVGEPKIGLAISLTKEETTGLTWRKAFYDLDVQRGTGKVEKLLQGVVYTDREVTTDDNCS